MIKLRMLTLASLCCVLAASHAKGEDPASNAASVVRVEETWELKVGAPNLERNAPQVTMVMSPFAHTSGKHFIMVMNHKTQPDYSAGGLQLQDWSGTQLLGYRNGPQGNELENVDETVTWTQSLTMSGDSVVFEITNGTSASWGNFGGQGYLRSTLSTHADNLNNYTPYVSISESGIDFAGNRVVSLVLQRVRWTMSDGQVYQLSAPIDIDGDLDPWTD